jgi:hypothetical protein
MITDDINDITLELSNCVISDDMYKILYLKTIKKNAKLKKKVKKLIKIVNDQNKYIVASKTAKNGYKEEELVVNDLNNNIEIQEKLSNFVGVSTLSKFHKKIGTTKTDITDGFLKIQVKKYKIDQFGQIDRHYLDYFFEKIPELILFKKLLTGICNLPVLENGLCDKSKNIIKLTKDNYKEEELNQLIEHLNKYKNQIINYAFLGYDDLYKPNMLLGVEYDKKKKRKKIIVYKMEDVINYLSTQTFKIRKSGTVIELGTAFTFQRKGGDSAKKTANHIQFKLVFSNLNIKNKLVHVIN